MKNRRSVLLWGLALVFLAAVIILVNQPRDKAGSRSSVPARSQDASNPAANRDSPGPAASQGNAVGDALPDFTVTCLDGSVFTLSEHRGAPVVINLWATWCGPCVKELGGFDRLQREHPGEVTVLALHSELVTEDVAAFLSAFDYEISFAVDGNGALIEALGGGDVLPQTLIVDPDGIVIYNKVGSLDEAKLKALVFPSGGE